MIREIFLSELSCRAHTLRAALVPLGHLFRGWSIELKFRVLVEQCLR
jgi:hypothetical protein